MNAPALLTQDSASDLDFQSDGFPTSAWHSNIEGIYAATCGRLAFPFFLLGPATPMLGLAESLAALCSQAYPEGNSAASACVAYFQSGGFAAVAIDIYAHAFRQDGEATGKQLRLLVSQARSSLPPFDIFDIANDGFGMDHIVLPLDFQPLARQLFETDRL